MVKKLTVKIPKSVRPLRKIGYGTYTKSGKPNSTFGHVAYELTGRICGDDEIAEIQGSGPYEMFNIVYALVYKYMSQHGLLHHRYDVLLFSNDINDELNHSDRVLVYNLTWAVLGYVDGQSARTLEYCDEVCQFVIDHYERESVRHYSRRKPVSTVKRLMTRNIKRRLVDRKYIQDSDLRPSFEYEYITV